MSRAEGHRRTSKRDTIFLAAVALVAGSVLVNRCSSPSSPDGGSHGATPTSSAPASGTPHPDITSGDAIKLPGTPCKSLPGGTQYGNFRCKLPDNGPFGFLTFQAAPEPGGTVFSGAEDTTGVIARGRRGTISVSSGFLPEGLSCQVRFRAGSNPSNSQAAIDCRKQ